MSDRDSHRRAPLAWATTAIGFAVMGYGVRGLLMHAADTKPLRVAQLLVVMVVSHDGLAAPITLVAGALVFRRLRPPWRAPITVASIVTAVTVVYAYPFVGEFGRIRIEPSRLPNDYAFGLARVLVAIWAVTIVWALLSARLRRAR